MLPGFVFIAYLGIWEYDQGMDSSSSDLQIGVDMYRCTIDLSKTMDDITSAKTMHKESLFSK